MDSDQYQDFTDEVSVYPDAGCGTITSLSYTCLGLAGETGEVANKVKKVIRGDYELSIEKKADIVLELGDVLFYLTRVAVELGYTLQEVIEANEMKLRMRKEKNKIKGEGDHR